MWLGSVRVQSSDVRLIETFLDSIRVLNEKSEGTQDGIRLLDDAEKIFRDFDPHLLAAFSTLISDIIFVESTIEDANQIFSFSDDSAPNVLYLAPRVNDQSLSQDDFSDSLLHEFLHHVLYHLERKGAFLFDNVHPSFPAPWRAGLRPSAGFFHGTFVFAGLTKFWTFLEKRNSIDHALKGEKARTNAHRFSAQALYGIASLRQFALLTPRGLSMLAQLENSLGSVANRLVPPGDLS